MNPLAKPVFWVISILLIIVIFLVLMPSIIGILLSAILVFAVVDFNGRRRRLAALTFNSAVRAVCHQDGAVGKVAVAFSRTGPLSEQCYDYARRLMIGENPVDAAARSRVPLELSTAIALELPDHRPLAGESDDHGDQETQMYDIGSMPAYGQFFYLMATACCTCGVLTWIGLRTVPEMESMIDEWGMGEEYLYLLDNAPAVTILAVLGFVVLILIPILSRGQLLGMRFDHRIPILPAVARRKGETLYGLADAIDAGMPMGRALAIGHTIAIGRDQRRRLETAMHGVAQGLPAPAALQSAALIRPQDQPWLQDTAPQRTAELLRVIADQGVRDARSNLRGLMSILFPLVIVILGAAVMAYMYGFLGTLMEFIRGLSKK